MAASAYTKDNPSERYVELGRIYRQVHESGLRERKHAAEQVFSGKSLYDHIPRVRALARRTGARTILDYGSGKGILYGQSNLALPDGTRVASIKDYWGVASIRCYDPGVPAFSAPPTTPS